MTDRDVDYDSDEERAYECLACGTILRAASHPGTCSDCGTAMRNRRTPLE
ncbi:rubrerythrin-like domain-containing protein [Halorussus halobius]|nr:rubrerythrin-like domain-containing protein [Halorussus halobius]